MRARVAWWVLSATLFQLVAVGLMAWWEHDWSYEALAAPGSAVGGVVVSACVGWARKRADAWKQVPGLPERALPPTPAGLLRADRRVVPFTGRAREYQELREWCRDDKPPVRLMVGAGGVGKTRLALELGDYLESCGWSVTVVAAGREADALNILRAATRHSSILLVVDYAETRTGLVELLRSVAGHSEHVRVLLIARSAGDWWEQLGSDVPTVRDLVQAYPPMTLSPEVDPVRSATELVHDAVAAFAEALDIRAPQIDVAVPGEVPLLALHAAALLAVLRSRDQRAPAGQLVADLGVLPELLGHERHFWEHSAEQAGLGLGPVVLARSVAVACLFGAVDERDGAQILRRVPDLREEEGRRRAVARWLAQLYPSGPGYWGTPQPELVAETHVITALQECPELVMAELPELRCDQMRQMLRVLSMGAAHQPAGQALVEQALRADLEPVVFPALEVARVTGGALGRVLARVLSDAPVTPPTLHQIEAAIPYPTTALAEAAVVVTHRILDTLPGDADIAETARWHQRLGVVLAQVGRADEALPHTDIAVGHYRTLVETDRDRYLPELAHSLHYLGNQYADRDRYADALRHTKQAVEHYRELVARDPGPYQADLAASLVNLGVLHAELGAHATARESFAEAEEHYRRLVETRPDRYRSGLARALRCRSRSDLSLLEDEVQRTRALVPTDRDRYLPDLAQALHDLGNAYAQRDQHPEAVHALTEALTDYRTLTEDLEVYRPELAACLNDLGVNLTELDDYDHAESYARESVQLNRQLTTINPARYRSELARSLDNLVVCLSKMDRYREARQPGEEAIELYRDLAGVDPDLYRPELARALTNFSVSLTELRRHAEAWPAAKEVVEIYRVLVETDRPRYSPLIARALRNLAVDYAGLNRHAEADACRREANSVERSEAML